MRPELPFDGEPYGYGEAPDKLLDLRTGTLRIAERFYRGDFSTVKSKRSHRDLPLGSVALETLKNWRSKSKGGQAIWYLRLGRESR